MARVPNAVETLPKIWTAWVGCTSVADDRQTDRQTDGRATAYSEREREFTFAKNCASVHAQHTTVLLFETQKLIYTTTRIILTRQLIPICPFICLKPIEFATFSRTVMITPVNNTKHQFPFSPEVYETSSKTGSRIRILYLLTGPTIKWLIRTRGVAISSATTNPIMPSNTSKLPKQMHNEWPSIRNRVTDCVCQ